MMLLPVLLCLVGIGAILAEFFIPAAGLIGIGGVGTIIAAVVMVFRDHGTLYGVIFLVGNALLVPAIIITYWKHFPKSFMGRRLILSPPPAAKTGGDAPSVDPPAPGKEGHTLTPLRPAGTAVFGNQRFSVVTDGEFLGKNAPVRIIQVEGNRIIVESVNAKE